VSRIALARLLHLSSQTLPIGGYSHSQGLESAIERREVTDWSSLERWIADSLRFCMGSFEIPCLLARAWDAQDAAAAAALNEEYLATRESAELRAATVQMGHSLRALLDVLPDMPVRTAEQLRCMAEPSLPCAWSAAASAWRIEPVDAAIGYSWAWAENQVLVAMKTVPLGQSAGHRVLLALGPRIAQLAAGCAASAVGVESAGASGSAEGPWLAAGSWSNFAPGLAILSSQHETQYSRLFRS
jgi:urease accessory protein